MDLFLTIIVSIIVGVLFGYFARGSEKFNVFVGFIVFGVTFLLFGCTPLLVVVLVAIGVYLSTDEFGPTIVAVIIVSVVFAGIFFAIPPYETGVAETGNLTLETLHKDFVSSGTFYLGFGTIDGAIYYDYNYMKNGELIPGSIKYDSSVHIWPNKTVGSPNISYRQSYVIRDLSQHPLNIIFNGVSGRTTGTSWTDINVPPDSIAREIKV